MVQDDIENHVYAVGVRRLHQRAQILAAAEVRIDLQEILHSVAVIRRLEGHLLEDGPDPDRGHPQAAEISELAREPLQGAAHECPAGLSPRLGLRGRLDGIPDIPPPIEETGGAGRHPPPRVVEVVALLVVGEAVGKEKVEHLVFPGGWRRMEPLPEKRLPVEVGQARRIHGIGGPVGRIVTVWASTFDSSRAIWQDRRPVEDACRPGERGWNL